MMGEAAGIAGDRRRNPFPYMNDTEYELFIYTIEKAVSTGVKTAMSEYRKENCEGHIERTIALETSVFGRREKGIVGLDEQVAENAAASRAVSARRASPDDSRMIASMRLS